MLALLFSILTLLVVSGCSPAGESTPTSTVEPAAPTAANTRPAATQTQPPTVVPTAAPGTYTNPVFAEDFPDPHVILVDDTYYAYGTTAAGANIQVIRSTNLARWERVGDAAPILPDWASPNRGLTWAPGVIEVDGTFIMYYVARDTESDLQCISMAVSDTPEGPFIDEAEEPFVCQTELGGSIDAYPYLDDDGSLYLYWKNDGNCCGKTVGLWVQALSEDGQTLVGEPTELIQMDQAWERPLIENPAVVKHEGTFYLFYSANWWESHEYAVGYAVCETVTGPCEKPENGPIFEFTPNVMGPGGESFFIDKDGNLWMAYHAWTGIDVGYPDGKRSLRIEPVGFTADGKPDIPGPTHTNQSFPGQ